MSKDVVQRLSRYQAHLKAKLEEKEIPTKHAVRADNYREFLNIELMKVTSKIEALKMSGK